MNRVVVQIQGKQAAWRVSSHLLLPPRRWCPLGTVTCDLGAPTLIIVELRCKASAVGAGHRACGFVLSRAHGGLCESDFGRVFKKRPLWLATDPGVALGWRRGEGMRERDHVRKALIARGERGKGSGRGEVARGRATLTLRVVCA